MEEKELLIGHYITRTSGKWAKGSTRGRVYLTHGIAPAMCAGMGGGGNIVPCVLICQRKQ